MVKAYPQSKPRISKPLRTHALLIKFVWLLSIELVMQFIYTKLSEETYISTRKVCGPRDIPFYISTNVEVKHSLYLLSFLLFSLSYLQNRHTKDTLFSE